MRIVLVLPAVILCGCASEFAVYDDARREVAGFPVRTPVLVEITRQTQFAVIQGSGHGAFSEYCTPKVHSSYAVLPLGDVHFVAFDAAALGKGEFSLQFHESGALKQLSVNSDMAAGLQSAATLAEAVLPFIAAPKAPDDGRQAAHVGDAEGLRKEHCLETGTTLVAIDRIEID